MNILHISMPKDWRGGEQQVFYTLKGLTKNYPNDNQILLTPNNSVLFSRSKNNNWKVYTTPKLFNYDFRIFLNIIKICKKENIDIIHCHDPIAHSQALNALKYSNIKIPIVLHRKVDIPIKDKKSSFNKYNNDSIKRIICVSNKVKEIAEEKIIKKEKLTTIRDCVDINKFNLSNTKSSILKEEYNLDIDTILIGNVSALVGHKDYYTFIDTAKYFLDNHNFYKVKFFIIGEGNEKDNLIKYAKEKVLENDIIFTGFRKDIENILPELDIFLFTSKEEGLGSTLLDAMACKIPVVSTNGGGISEIVKNNTTGLICNVKDYKCLSDKIYNYLEDEKLKEEIINTSYKYVCKNHSLDIMAKKIYNIYSSII